MSSSGGNGVVTFLVQNNDGALSSFSPRALHEFVIHEHAICGGPLGDGDLGFYLGRQLISALKERFANLRERPDAIFAVHGDASVSAYEFLLDSSYKIPQEVALIGFDEFPLAGTLRPTLSVIRQPINELGTTAARMLFEQIEGEPGNPPGSLSPRN